MAVKKKDPAAVAPGRKGGRKGGPARAAKLTPEQRSESARKAVLARWAKAKNGSSMVAKQKVIGAGKFSDFGTGMVEGNPAPDTSRKALHLCLKRLKNAKDENEIRRLTEELQRIVFHKQYQNAEN